MTIAMIKGGIEARPPDPPDFPDTLPDTLRDTLSRSFLSGSLKRARIHKNEN